MNQLFPLPLYTFLKMTIKNGGISLKKLKNTVPWLLKTVLFEPVRWAELGLYNKKIRQHEIVKHPVFILGFYRSGTSYLHQCMVQDDRFGYHTNFQMVLPEVMLISEKTLLPVFKFIARFFKLTDSVHRVPLSFRFPGEEDATMTTTLDPRGAQWGYFFPKCMHEQFKKYVLFEDITASEVDDWKQAFMFMLKKISLASAGKQLILKSPPNTARIKLLLSLFPDAKFIFIHRNPYEVYASNKKFWKVVQKTYALKGVDPVDVNSIILNTYYQIMNRYLQEKDLVPPGQLIELRYEDFIKAPVLSMRQVYETLDLNPFSYCESKLASFTGLQKKFVVLDHKLPPDERRTVAEKWERFFKYWNYKLE
jgi:hypothetical protein